MNYYFIAVATATTTGDISNGCYKYLKDPTTTIEKLMVIDNFWKLIDPEEALTDSNGIYVSWHAEFVMAALRVAGFKTQTTQWRSVDVWRAQSGLGTKIDRTPDEWRFIRETSNRSQLQLFDLGELDTKREELVRKEAIVTMATWNYMCKNYPLTEPNWSEWHTHIKINTRGVLVDQQFLNDYAQVMQEARNQSEESIRKLMKSKNPTNRDIVRFIDHLSFITIKDLTRGEIKRLSEVKVPYPDEKEKINKPGEYDRKEKFIRMQWALIQRDVTSDNKEIKLQQSYDDSFRLRGAYRFNGAVSGRWSSPGVNLHNLTKDGELSEIKICRDFVSHRKSELFVVNSDGKGRGWLVRTAFISELGKLVMLDYKQIEARLISAFAGEAWKVKAFEDGSDLYKVSASKLFGVSIHSVTPEQRAYGKIAEIALGYGGGVNVLEDRGISRSLAQKLLNEWRANNPHIVELWERFHKAYTYTYHEGLPSEVNGVKLSIIGDNDIAITLLTGRTFVCVEMPTSINGATIAARVISGMARDILATAMVQLTDMRYRIVMHNQDEIVIDLPAEGIEREIKKIKEVMINSGNVVSGLLLPLPLDVDVKVNNFYY